MGTQRSNLKRKAPDEQPRTASLESGQTGSCGLRQLNASTNASPPAQKRVSPKRNKQVMALYKPPPVLPDSALINPIIKSALADVEVLPTLRDHVLMQGRVRLYCPVKGILDRVLSQRPWSISRTTNPFVGSAQYRFRQRVAHGSHVSTYLGHPVSRCYR